MHTYKEHLRKEEDVNTTHAYRKCELDKKVNYIWNDDGMTLGDVLRHNSV